MGKDVERGRGTVKKRRCKVLKIFCIPEVEHLYRSSLSTNFLTLVAARFLPTGGSFFRFKPQGVRRQALGRGQRNAGARRDGPDQGKPRGTIALRLVCANHVCSVYLIYPKHACGLCSAMVVFAHVRAFCNASVLSKISMRCPTLFRGVFADY